MDKELKTKLVREVLEKIPFIGPRVREEIVSRILAIDEMDTKAQEAYVLADKIKEKKALEVKVAEAQRVLETDVPRLNTLIAELPVEKVIEPAIDLLKEEGGEIISEEMVDIVVEDKVEEIVEEIIEP